ncbi:MAG: Ig-like domain-containing protein [Ruminococcus sp.]|nr:Ig-like domain-containing protein [Ruminococcus sp.]
MTKRIAFVLVIAMLFSFVFGANPVYASQEGEQEQITDQYGGDTLLAQYSTADIVKMFPEFSEYLSNEIRSLNTNITVERFDIFKEDVGAIYFSVMSENPELFYVLPTRFSSTANYETGKVLAIRPEYCFDLEDIPSAINEYNARVNYILSGVQDSWNDLAKARYMHDVLAHFCEYDTRYESISDGDYELFKVQMRIYTSYGALVDNNAVCEGYSMAYKYLLSLVGVESHYIQSVKNHHAWNMVKLGDNYYHVDIAHDDPTNDTLGRVNHNNFLKSDNWFNNDGDGEHSDWITNLKAEDTSLDNAWWNNVNTIIYRYDGYDYYINQRYTSSVYAALTRRNISTGEEEVLDVKKTRWNVKDVEGAFWDKAFSFITCDGNYFYFNDTENIYRVTIGGSTIEKIYTKPSTIKDNIYGLAYMSSGGLFAAIKDSPFEKDVVYKINIPTQPTSTTEPTESTIQTTEPTSTQNFTQPTATEPSSQAQTQPTATEPIGSVATEPPKLDPIVIKKSLKLYLKGSSQITLSPKGAYKFSSSNSKVAAVTNKGQITAKKAGKAVITAKGDNVIFRLTVTVKNPKLNYTKKTIKRKKSFNLKVIGGSGKITLTQSNNKIKINSKGKVTGLKKGKTTITVKVCGLKLKCKVIVK